MNEDRLVAEALLAALAERSTACRGTEPADHEAASPRPRAIQVVVNDPVHVAPDRARLFAELAMRARGLAAVPIDLRVESVICQGCGLAIIPDEGSLFCPDCGWLLLEDTGPEIEIRALW